MPEALSCRGLSVPAGRRTIVQPTDLTLGEGEWKALVGPNGAGKSTLLKALALLVPFKGAVLYRGEPVGKAERAYRSGLGVVLHEPLVYRGLTAWENLMLYADLYGVSGAREVVSSQLEAVGLGRFAHDPVRQYSRGMMQRLSVARALLHRPKVLLLDEPLSGIDDGGAATIVAILTEAKRQGVSALWITHRWDRAWDVVDEVVQMSRGRLHASVRTDRVDRESWTPEHAGAVHSGRSGAGVDS